MSTKPLSSLQIMNRIYKDIDGFEIPKNDAKAVRESKGSPIYGEINHQSLHKLHDLLKLKPSDVFFDLGSGVGKVIIQTALTSKAGKSIGVELSTARHADALQALDNAKNWDNTITKRCTFINADMLTVDLSAATVIYTCSTAFSLGFMKKVTDYLASFKQPFRLISLQDLPPSKHFELIHRPKLNMSWVRNTSVYVYQRL